MSPLKGRRLRLACVVTFVLVVAMDLAGPSARETAPSGEWSPKLGPRNVIVMIADGSGYNHVAAASLYQYGRTGAQPHERFPFRFGMSTHSASGHGYDPALAWTDFDWVNGGATDSAAAATAMSTGHKTYNGAIGVDAMRNPVEHVLERAEQLGKATGVVSSVQISHATPAGFVAHNVSRSNYAAIAREMILHSAADVIMGAGHPLYTNDGALAVTPNYTYVGGKATWDALNAGKAGGDADGDGAPDPWVLVETRSQFQSLVQGETPIRVLGIAQVRETLQQARRGVTDCDGDGDVDRDDAKWCGPYVDPLTESVPTLREMTAAALNVLDDDPDGLFLMVEGGAVDSASHANQSGRMIEEQIDFDMAVDEVIGWVRGNSSWGETLLIVTSDHETGYLLGPGSDPTWEPLTNNGRGNVPGMEWHSGSHTNSLVPVFAKGPGARWLRSCANGYDPAHGRYVDNTEIAKLIFDLWGGSHTECD